MAHPLKKELPFFLVALSVVIADQLTKFLVRSRLPLNESFPAQGPLRLTHVANPGAAFGLLAHPLLLIGVSLLVILLLLFSYRHEMFATPAARAALGLMLGGAVGNLLDRMRQGYVTDFIDLRVWPVFNLADSALVVGSLLLVYQVAVSRKPSPPGHG